MRATLVICSRSCALCALVILALILGPQAARCQGLDGLLFRLTASPHDTLTNQTTSVLGQLQLHGALALSYLNDPLTGDDSSRLVSLVRHRVAAEASLAFGLWDRLEVAAALSSTLAF